MNKKELIRAIDDTIKDLPKHKELAREIASFVLNNDYYNKAQVSQVVDMFYNNEPTGWGVVDDLFSEGIL